MEINIHIEYNSRLSCLHGVVHNDIRTWTFCLMFQLFCIKKYERKKYHIIVSSYWSDLTFKKKSWKKEFSYILIYFTNLKKQKKKIYRLNDRNTKYWSQSYRKVQTKLAQTETYTCNLSFFKTLGSEIKVIG